MQLNFGIRTSGAWSPYFQQMTDWQQWPTPPLSDDSLPTAAPKLPQVPAMQRRRYSKLTKMLLDVAFQCNAPANCRTIFASRHGELNRTVELLQDIVQQQPISPIGFSQSVHNTASGIFSILTGNCSASTSIAAAEQTLEQALIEAYGQLHEDESELLLVYGDEPVADIYQEFTDEPELPLALAFLLGRPENNPAAITLTLETEPTEQQYACAPHISYGEVLHALANKQALDGRLNQCLWRLTYA
ncbi:beta-ketoacyl synthase chain length factor [Shewanella sp. Isolate11]|uniref:beta-ketoacyl synthase chain length factor n=1 Tax=Shewanella sp. Isolate11 TaxID=2908530 RepID=UPI001EFDF69D|nr:beta-ketoacyl synthase chain length factor [Shewanella sp. Isolate11]MCG9697826.1 beta-ketoacyl synthase chain length factor [Shewanella sp. Isolate11]